MCETTSFWARLGEDIVRFSKRYVETRRITATYDNIDCALLGRSSARRALMTAYFLP
jgi:hypothetical protein